MTGAPRIARIARPVTGTLLVLLLRRRSVVSFTFSDAKELA